jgi:tetratricopeptide (TPR) repeat protein
MDRRRYLISGIGLFLLTLAVYWPATTFQFTNFDDQVYVYENPAVTQGLSGQGMLRMLFSIEPHSWHPLTMISHMADVSLYGLNAGGHHLTNILLHAINASLLWLLVVRLTGWVWPGALVAALFAWHPLNVESVAWIAERKNVLSTLFFILTLLAYCGYMQEKKPARFYVLALICFALGLAAKPMLVTVPFLLLVLDWWPLNRTQASGGKLRCWMKLAIEKIPFLALSSANIAITCIAQAHAGAVRSLDSVPLEQRLANIPQAYLAYLEKTFWPANLSVFYPLPTTIQWGAAAVSSVILALLTAAAWRLKQRAPWFLTGWLWFLGTLVPVIGLVQVGDQAMADRYAYVSLIGIFLILAGALNEYLRQNPRHQKFSAVLAAIILAGCLTATARQLTCWRDSIALFTQAISVDARNAKAHSTLGRAYSAIGQSAPAVDHFAIAVRLRPSAKEWWFDLGRELITAGKYNEAALSLGTALDRFPDNAVLHNLRGVALTLAGNQNEACAEFLRAIALSPDYANPYFNLGKSLAKAGRPAEAVTQFSVALRLNPDWPETLQSLAQSHAALGDFTTAINEASKAQQLALAAHQSVLAETLAAEIKTYQAAAAVK